MTKTGQTYTPATTARYEKLIRETVWLAKNRPRAPSALPIAIEFRFFMPIPKSWPKWRREKAVSGRLFHTSKPDLDNLIKAVKDALKGFVYHDDSQIALSTEAKTYSSNPHVEVRVYEMDDMEDEG